MLNRTMIERKSQYYNLENFTKEIDKEIVEATGMLEWKMESVKMDSDNRLVCPYDWSHRIGKKMLDQHLERCLWKQEGYDECDQSLPDSSLPLNSCSSIKLDGNLQNGIIGEAKRTDSTMKVECYEYPTWHKLCSGERLIPRTSDRILTDFTGDERRVLYQFVVSNTVKPDVGYDIADIQKLRSQDKKDKEDGKLSYLELLIHERNLKRRRTKHRGVHTNKKSHTEILREMVHQQMQLYTDYLLEKNAIENSRSRAVVCESESSSGKHKGSSRYRETFSSRSNQEYKYTKGLYIATASGARDGEEYSRAISESTRTERADKRRKSRLGERERDRRSKHVSKRTHYRKNSVNP